MQLTREKMNIMHKNNVNIVGEDGNIGLAIENGKLWSNLLSSEASETIENSLATA